THGRPVDTSHCKFLSSHPRVPDDGRDRAVDGGSQEIEPLRPSGRDHDPDRLPPWPAGVGGLRPAMAADRAFRGPPARSPGQAGVGIARVEVDSAGKITIIALGAEPPSEDGKSRECQEPGPLPGSAAGTDDPIADCRGLPDVRLIGYSVQRKLSHSFDSPVPT